MLLWKRPVVAAQTQAPVVEGGKVRATPKARKVARELGIDLAQVPGTGAKVVFMLMTLRTLRVLNLRQHHWHVRLQRTWY
ncbi:MAG: E3 binding domain-containing protein [Streptococcus thermophilus]